jgi:uncharacterized coiled-coil DUF342 family protein
MILFPTMATALPDWHDEMVALSEKVEMLTGYFQKLNKRLDELEKTLAGLSNTPQDYKAQEGVTTLANLRKSIGQLGETQFPSFIMPD